MTDPFIHMTVRGLSNLERTVTAENRRQKKALDTAVRVEGFRLMRLLKKEIRQGAPGGRKFAPLSYIARRRMHRGRNSPLRRLAVAVRYHVADRQPLQVEIGWTGPKVSKRWKYLARVLQEGFEHGMAAVTRAAIIQAGSRMTKRTKARRYHFIRQSTRRFTTPARPIMEPFWDAHEDDARRNITKNFRRKMKGETFRLRYSMFFVCSSPETRTYFSTNRS